MQPQPPPPPQPPPQTHSPPHSPPQAPPPPHAPPAPAPPQPQPQPLPQTPPRPQPPPQPPPQPLPQPLQGLDAPPPVELDNDDNDEAALHNFLEDEKLEVGIDVDDAGTNPTITLEGVRDSVVSSRTLRGYVEEIIKFLVWCVGNKPNWLMDDGRDQIAHITEEHGGEGVCAWRSCTHTEFLGLLH